MYKAGLVYVAACLGMLLFGISLITLGSVATDLQERFMLGGADTGILFSLLPFGILTGSLVFGPICDRYGYKLLLVLACLSMFVGFEGIAYVRSLVLLKICIFLFGVGGGVINGSTNALVADISVKNKGANLSLLGVFFGLGALAMPLVLGMVSRRYNASQVVAAVGLMTLIAGLYYLIIRFPPAKQRIASGEARWRSLLKPFLLLVAFFLFFQSSLEAIINNWTTTYLTTRGVMHESRALYGLSLHIAGMVVMRVLTGTVLRPISHTTILWASLVMLATGVLLMQVSETQVVIAGLVLSGAGLAGGFPIMLGFVGERFRHLSGTAFSVVFTFALIGNMLINYVMGIIVERYGVHHLITVSCIEIVIMAMLFFVISRKLTSTSK